MKFNNNKLRELRNKHDLSLEELGEKIHFNFSNLSKIERGEREPKLELVEKLSEFYHVPIGYFWDEDIQIPADWITVIKEMEEKHITPDDILYLLRVMDKFKK